MFKLLLICVFILQGCSSSSIHRKSVSFSQLSIGMQKSDVEQIFGDPNMIRKSSDGYDILTSYYGKDGYLWYNEKNELEGFGSYQMKSDIAFVEINRASGYLIKKGTKKKIYFQFEPYQELKSSEALMVFLENRKYIEKTFESFGYTAVSNKEKADLIIITKMGISDPRITQEITSTPVYKSHYEPPQQVTTKYYGTSGSGTSKTTYGNTLGSYQTHYAGQNVHTSTDRTFFRSLEFIAIDPAVKNNQDNILWSTIVVSEGSRDDIRIIFPYLLYATIPIVNQSTSYGPYKLAGYHTGVNAVVGMDVPRFKVNH